MDVTFLLNGEMVRVSDVAPTLTLLEWLREQRGLSGTKEGCNEGDCGACTVMMQDGEGHHSVNACILLLPQLHGKAITTVEGVGADASLHPVQEAMIAHHGSQCGFCTPGIVMSLATSHLHGTKDDAASLAGNLCRCTGYAPILRAAEAARAHPAPAHLHADLSALPEGGAGTMEGWSQPSSGDELAALYEAHPDATLVAGATEVGLWVTKKLFEPERAIFIGHCRDLARIEEGPEGLRLGALVSLERLITEMEGRFPSYAAMLGRFASPQVRASATLGGNIAEGSPIGDNAPALIALAARLHLRKGDRRREIALEDFFLDYRKQDRAPGEFVEAITIPAQEDRLKVYKLSKRFDQDISAVCGAFSIRVEGGVVQNARIAFGGMAGVPKRARCVERALEGAVWGDEALALVESDVWEQDFTPMSDMRASASYRLRAARNLLARYLHEDLAGNGPRHVLEVAP